MMKVIAIGGEPGSGKSSLMKRVMADMGFDIHSPEKFGDLIYGYKVPNENLYILGKYEGEGYAQGTDRLSMAVQPKIVEWMKTLPQDTIILYEGDRIFNQSFLEHCAEVSELHIIYLKTDASVREARYKERGSDQDEKFLRGRETKYANILANFGLREYIETMENNTLGQRERIVKHIAKLTGTKMTSQIDFVTNSTPEVVCPSEKECDFKEHCQERCSIPDPVKVKTIIAPVAHDCEHLLGTYLDESHYDTVIDEDCDFYAPPTGLEKSCGEHNIIFKLRKNIFTPEEQAGAYEGLIGAAVETQNRGLAAGPRGEMLNNREWATEEQLEILDALMVPPSNLFGQDPIDEIVARYAGKPANETRLSVWKRTTIEADGLDYRLWFKPWVEEVRKLPVEERAKRARYVAENYISDTNYAKSVCSGIAGFFDRYPRLPYGRSCAYNERNPELFQKAFPYLHKLDKFFSELLPVRYAAQREAGKKLDPKFLVDGTVFTTITVNKNFRTAAHRDAGDLSTGYSNLGVVTNGKDYKGGYLVLPQFRVAVNIRPGDVLLINNHEGIHGNTEIIGDEGFERCSLVCYFREAMLDLGSWDYEYTRRKFVETRKNNKEHPQWRPLWNGVSADMWKSKEWYDFLTINGGFEMLQKYHPEGVPLNNATLDNFFE